MQIYAQSNFDILNTDKMHFYVRMETIGQLEKNIAKSQTS